VGGSGSHARSHVFRRLASPVSVAKLFTRREEFTTHSNGEGMGAEEKAAAAAHKKEEAARKKAEAQAANKNEGGGGGDQEKGGGIRRERVCGVWDGQQSSDDALTVTRVLRARAGVWWR
jgi:hypothetical protein